MQSIIFEFKRAETNSLDIVIKARHWLKFLKNLHYITECLVIFCKIIRYEVCNT